MAKKILNPIRIKGVGEVFVTVTWDGRHLSLTGVEGPRQDGYCRGDYGQIDMSLREDDRANWAYNPGWDGAMMTQLLEVWDRWHLNDMFAGTPAQEAFLREWKNSNRYTYPEACNALSRANLLIDYDFLPADEDGERRGYRYGASWLTEKVPEDVIEWLFALPDAAATMPSCWRD